MSRPGRPTAIASWWTASGPAGRDAAELSKAAACLDAWPRHLAPPDALRRWFGHDPAKCPELRERYRAELAASPTRPQLEALAGRAREATVTLLSAARDSQHNNAVVLAEALTEVPSDVTAGGDPAARHEPP